MRNDWVVIVIVVVIKKKLIHADYAKDLNKEWRVKKKKKVSNTWCTLHTKKRNLLLNLTYQV